MSFTFGEAGSLNLTWKEWGDLNLTWFEIENLSFEGLVKLASEKLERFQFLRQDFEIPAQTKIEIENLYIAVQPLVVTEHAKSQGISAQALLLLFLGAIITKAVELVAEHPTEIIEAVMSALRIMNQILSGQ